MVNRIISLISLSDLSLLVHRNVTNFCLLILYLEALLNSLISPSSFLVTSIVFPMDSITSYARSDSFTSSFSIQNPFYLFSSLIAITRTSKTMLNETGEREHSLSYSWSWKKPFSSSLLSIMLVVGLSYMNLYYVEVCSLCACFLEISKWFLSTAFSVYIEMIIQFLSFSLLMWCITHSDFQILKNPCIPAINPTWIWYMILLMYC